MYIINPCKLSKFGLLAHILPLTTHMLLRIAHELFAHCSLLITRVLASSSHIGRRKLKINKSYWLRANRIGLNLGALKLYMKLSIQNAFKVHFYLIAFWPSQWMSLPRHHEVGALMHCWRQCLYLF